MSCRHVCMLAKLCLGIAVLAMGLAALAAPASAQFSVEWVQLGGNFRVAATRAGPPNSPLCVHGLSCACPGSRNFCGQHRNGAEVSFWKDGCNRPPMTIQCVIRPTGAGSPSGNASRQPVCSSFAQHAERWDNTAKGQGCRIKNDKTERQYFDWCMNTSDAEFRNRSSTAAGHKAGREKECSAQLRRPVRL